MKTRKQRYEEALQHLADAISKAKEPLTASTLAKRFKCTRATIYNRLTELDHRGFKLRIVEIRDGKRGPLSTAVSAA